MNPAERPIGARAIICPANNSASVPLRAIDIKYTSGTPRWRKRVAVRASYRVLIGVFIACAGRVRYVAGRVAVARASDVRGNWNNNAKNRRRRIATSRPTLLRCKTISRICCHPPTRSEKEFPLSLRRDFVCMEVDRYLWPAFKTRVRPLSLRVE